METGESSMSNSDPGEIACKIQNNVSREKAAFIQYQTECCIFKVPKLLRDLKVDAYTPMVLSIGPYHRMDERLRSMEPYKLRDLNFFFSDKGKSRTLVSCVEKILEKEDQIRGSYADHISLSSDDFVQMVLVDSLFLIQLFLWAAYPSYRFYQGLNSVFERIQANEIRHDLLLLENQLPLFIIHEIYNIFYPAGFYDTFEHIVGAFFGSESMLNLDISGQKHLLDLVRNHCVGSFKPEPSEREPFYMTSPTASDLHAAGVKFKAVGHGYYEGLLEIKFDKDEGVLTIPCMIINDPIQSTFRNMIALEQCMYLYNKPTYITDYLFFLDCLINTKEDVQLLVDQGIIVNLLGSDVICETFNTISKNTRILPKDYSYWRLSKKLNNHCRRKWNNHKATLKNKYLAHPWAVISVIYAIVLLLLTIAQVVLAILALPGVL